MLTAVFALAPALVAPCPNAVKGAPPCAGVGNAQRVEVGEHLVPIIHFHRKVDARSKRWVSVSLKCISALPRLSCS
jgi:hypothetical protein